MKSIQAFVAHSFDQEDEQPVRAILQYLTNLSTLYPAFSWQHAEDAEPKSVAQKVLSLFRDKNFFIAICTRKEFVVKKSAISRRWYSNTTVTAKTSDFIWKTSDWIIQEIGLAAGLGLDVMLLIEEGVKTPGELQGNLEHIIFQRNAPEKSFTKILQMISARSIHAAIRLPAVDADIATTSSKSSEEDPEAEVSAEWMTPKEGWNFDRYRSAIIHACIKEDEKAIENLYIRFLETEYAVEKANLAIWSAHEQFARLVLSFGGSLKRLIELSDEYSQLSKVIEYLARVYRNYEEHEKAGVQYERASRVAQELVEEVRLLGAAAICYQNSGNSEIARNVMEAVRKLVAFDNSAEEAYLSIEKDMAQLTKDDDIEIAAMERALELDPTDSSTRFSLAFKHSGRDHHALAAWHYSRISASDRHGMAWNNLGVALQRLDLPGKSVQAYREAEKKDETLAMSNLANKFVDAGFMSEAKALCERASKITDYHRNVDVSKSRIADAIDDETKVETEKFSEAKIESDFYKGLGRSLLLSNVCDLNGEWAGPDCTLSFSVSDSKIVAEGQYEPVLYGMSKILGLTSEPSVMKIEYVGMRIRGAIISTVIRKEIKAEVVVQSLLSSFEDSTNALMSVQENCREIWIMERNKNDKPKYYKIFRK